MKVYVLRYLETCKGRKSVRIKVMNNLLSTENKLFLLKQKPRIYQHKKSATGALFSFNQL
jgi:hypothetical protein